MVLLCINKKHFSQGTSIGSFLAFYLVGGNKDSKGKRYPKTMEECLDWGSKAVGKVWVKSKNGKGFLDWFLKKKGFIGEVPLTPYTQELLRESVEEIVGTTTLTNEIKYNGCLAGAVVRQFNEDPMNKPDVLDIFDSKSKPAQVVSEVLLGATTAPIYFEIPYKIGTQNYIDGGISGKIKY